MNKEIKQSEKNILQAYINKVFDKEKIIDEKMLDDIANISIKNKLEIAVISNRKGEILDIIIGDSVSASISADILQGKGLRVIHTHPFAFSTLSDKDKLLLKKYDIDYIIAISYFVGLKIYKISKASIKNNWSLFIWKNINDKIVIRGVYLWMRL